MRTVAIIDIDTTIANNEHRADLLTRVCTKCAKPMGGKRGQDKWPVCECGNTAYHAPPSSWEAFLHPEAVSKDTPQPHALDVINTMRKNHWYVTFMTARGERLRDVTEKWLNTHINRQVGEPLIMRPVNKDGVPSSQMKEQMFLDFRESRGFEHSQFLFFDRRMCRY